MMNFMGYKRLDGSVGVRNYIGIIPSVFCANRVCQVIASQVDGAIALTHPLGCAQVGEDLEITARTLKAMGRHPNLGAVLVVGLGCERFKAKELFDAVKETGKPAEMIVIQDEGDTLKAIEKGVRIAKGFSALLSSMQREPCDLSALTVAVKCGGTDATSGLAANPAVGAMSDLLYDNGGSIFLSEINELLGTENFLAKRAVNNEVAQKIYKTIGDMEESLKKATRDPRFAGRAALISPGNFDGGVSSVTEKALGGVFKAGTRPITNVLAYAEPPINGEKGVFLMDSCSHDGEVVTGMVGGGAQIVVFTTGRGTPTGFPFVPVIKVTGNNFTYEKMRENIDFCAGAIISEGLRPEEMGNRLFKKLIATANGEKTKAELLMHDELFCITRKES